MTAHLFQQLLLLAAAIHLIADTNRARIAEAHPQEGP